MTLGSTDDCNVDMSSGVPSILSPSIQGSPETYSLHPALLCLIRILIWKRGAMHYWQTEQ